MRYFLEFNKKNEPIGYAIQNKDVKGNKLTEVEPLRFKQEMKNMGIDFILPDEKIELNILDIQDLGESTAYVLEDSTTTAEMLVYALEEIESLKLEIETLKGGN